MSAPAAIISQPFRVAYGQMLPAVEQQIAEAAQGAKRLLGLPVAPLARLEEAATLDRDLGGSVVSIPELRIRVDLTDFEAGPVSAVVEVKTLERLGASTLSNLLATALVKARVLCALEELASEPGQGQALGLTTISNEPFAILDRPGGEFQLTVDGEPVGIPIIALSPEGRLKTQAELTTALRVELNPTGKDAITDDFSNQAPIALGQVSVQSARRPQDALARVQQRRFRDEQIAADETRATERTAAEQKDEGGRIDDALRGLENDGDGQYVRHYLRNTGGSIVLALDKLLEDKRFLLAIDAKGFRPNEELKPLVRGLPAPRKRSLISGQRLAKTGTSASELVQGFRQISRALRLGVLLDQDNATFTHSRLSSSASVYAMHSHLTGRDHSTHPIGRGLQSPGGALVLDALEQGRLSVDDATSLLSAVGKYWKPETAGTGIVERLIRSVSLGLSQDALVGLTSALKSPRMDEVLDAFEAGRVSKEDATALAKLCDKQPSQKVSTLIAAMDLGVDLGPLVRLGLESLFTPTTDRIVDQCKRGELTPSEATQQIMLGCSRGRFPNASWESDRDEEWASHSSEYLTGPDWR